MKLRLLVLLLTTALAFDAGAQTKVKTTGITDLAVTQAKLAADSVTAAKIVDGAVGTAEIDANAVTSSEMADNAIGSAEITDGTVGAGDLASTLDLSGKTLTLPAAYTPVFTSGYTSTNQTVTAGGQLVLAHGLSGMPALVQVRLKCTTAELGYSIGDEVIINPGASYVSSSTGLSLVPDATNITVRFGSSGGGVSVARKDTGALAIVTAASWVLIVKAWL